MRKIGFCSLMLMLACSIQASWYWPFGSDESSDRVRLSELMEPASLLIDDAADFATDGKVKEAVEKYRAALAELDRIEMENPERAATAEFATLRNKRAYVNAAIDSLLLSQVKSNAKVVAVSDTTALEKKLAEERATIKGEGIKGEEKGEKVKGEDAVKGESAKGEEVEGEKVKKTVKKAVKKTVKAKRKLTKREQVMQDIVEGDFAAAELLIDEMLVEKPNGAMALNLKAALQVKQGRYKEAERTLDQAIMSNPRSYYAYYNMADLILKMNPSGKIAAKRYYETGRAMGGPVDEKLEGAFK